MIGRQEYLWSSSISIWERTVIPTLRSLTQAWLVIQKNQTNQLRCLRLFASNGTQKLRELQRWLISQVREILHLQAFWMCQQSESLQFTLKSERRSRQSRIKRRDRKLLRNSRITSSSRERRIDLHLRQRRTNSFSNQGSRIEDSPITTLCLTFRTLSSDSKPNSEDLSEEQTQSLSLEIGQLSLMNHRGQSTKKKNSLLQIIYISMI